MNRVSFSRVEAWKQCPRKYRYRYIEQIPTEPSYEADNPLILGSTLDLGIQKGYEEAEKYYWSQLPVATDDGVLELMKIEHWLKQLRPVYNKGEFQMRLLTDRFIGFADYVEDNLLVDFKYSNGVDKYAESAQLHVYASQMPKIPEHMAYVCVPKLFIGAYKDGESKEARAERVERLRQWKINDIQRYRKYVMDEINRLTIKTIWVEYDRDKVEQFWQDVDAMENDTEFEMCRSKLCSSCPYSHICDEEAPRRKRKVKPRAELLNT